MTISSKLATVTTVILVVAWMAGLSLAAGWEVSKSKPAEAQQVQKAGVHAIFGTVTAVAPDARTLEVKAPQGKSDFLVVGASVTDQTIVREGKSKKSPADLKVGDHARWAHFVLRKKQENLPLGTVTSTLDRSASRSLRSRPG